jgi:hypothetical protein
MTNDDLIKDWRDISIEVSDGPHTAVVKLKDRYALCYGYQDQFGGVAFDDGGPVAEMHVFVVRENDELHSINPYDHTQSEYIGKLKRF